MKIAMQNVNHWSSFHKKTAIWIICVRLTTTALWLKCIRMWAFLKSMSDNKESTTMTKFWWICLQSRYQAQIWLINKTVKRISLRFLLADAKLRKYQSSIDVTTGDKEASEHRGTSNKTQSWLLSFLPVMFFYFL